jgi:hypothetical protein
MPSRLERLFEYYAADLRRFAPKYSDHFGCPLCYRVFKKVDNLGELVAEEHVVSKQLGGRIVTLTCRSCNSEHGTKLDAHLVQRVRIEANKRPMRTRFKMGTVAFGAEMYGRMEPGSPIKIAGVRKQSDPRQVEEVKRLLREGRTINLNVNLGYNENRSLVALVRSAYLLMFRTFGYRYVLDSSAKVVREQLQNPPQKMPVLSGIMWRITEPVPPGNTLTIMHTPESIRSFLAILRLDDDTGHAAAVTLPAPGTDGSDLYPRLRLPESQGTKTLQPLPIPKVGFLPFIETWRYVVEVIEGSAHVAADK